MKKKPISILIDEKKELIEYLKESRLFAHLPENLLKQIAEYSELIEYPAGAEILKEGEINYKTFFLFKGVVAVYAGGELILKLNRKGDLIGEMSVISEKPTSATVIAETQVRLFCIKAGDIGKYTDADGKSLQNTLYRIFSKILTEKLAITTHKAKKYETVNRQLYHRINLEKLISTISSLFIDINVDRIGDTVNQAIKMIGEFYRYQRSYLFLLSNTKSGDKTIYEWCSDEKRSWLKPFQESLDDIVSSFRLTAEQDVGVYAPSIIDLPPEVIKDSSFTEKDKSLFIVPLLIQKKLIGFIAFSPAPPVINIQKEDLAMIGIVGEIFHNVIDRKRTGEKLQQAFMAGMAENAISVLHHIGNAITPAVVNINSLLSTTSVPSAIEYLDKIHQSLTAHLQSGDLSDFLTEDKKGREMMPFFKKLIQELKTSTSRHHQYLEGVDHQLQQISEIVSLQQKYINLQNYGESFYLSTIINDILEMMQPAFGNNRIEIINKIDPNLPSLTLEKNKLVYVLMNLLKNAVESIDAQMQKTPEMQPTIKIQAFLKDKDRIGITFQDSGVGISGEEMKRVFEFGYSTKTHSSGFGLFDCENFIRLHKGELKLTSAGPGHGATVEFTLPAIPTLVKD